jgi:hypothetical protein
MWLVLLSSQLGDLEKAEMYYTNLAYGYTYNESGGGVYVCPIQ